MQKQRRNRAGKELLSCSHEWAPSQRMQTTVNVHLLEISGKYEPGSSVQLDRITCKLQRLPAVLWEGTLQEVNAVGFLWAFCPGADFSHGSVPSRESTTRASRAACHQLQTTGTAGCSEDGAVN